MRQFNYPDIKGGRAVGNSSRQVNYIIDEMFNNFGEYIPVIDHFSLSNDKSTSASINKMLLDKIIIRLKTEFKLTESQYTVKSQNGKLFGITGWERFENLNKIINNKKNYFIIKLNDSN